MNSVPIKALSVNKAWQGKRFKTPVYKQFERDTLLLLPKTIDIPEKPLCLRLEFGYSSKLADFDNGVKPFVDILQKKYGFNDRDIKLCFIAVNNNVKKGEEYIKFAFDSILDNERVAV